MELYIFNQDDNLLTILSKETGLIDTWFKDYENHIPDEPFSFNVSKDKRYEQSYDAEYNLTQVAGSFIGTIEEVDKVETVSPIEFIREENQVAFYDRDNVLRLVRIKELYEITTNGESIIKVKCEPSFLELYDHFIEDKRINNGTAQTALNRALEGSRYIGEVTVELGNATDNFYWIDGITAVFKILNTWGGSLKDTITLNDKNEIVERKLMIVQRLGADNGLIVEPDHNAESISRNTLSYIKTALWGQGASLETDNGGFTRYITFEDIEWKVSKGDPVDKPLGQKWVGDPQTLASNGLLHNGVRKHQFGHYSNQDYEDPEELLMATWLELQDRKLKEVIHEATIYESDKKVSLGDTATILNREYTKPIELQSQITGLEYDILEPDEEIKIIVGKYIDMNEDPLEKEVDDLKDIIKRPQKPITDNSFPDIEPGTPINVTATGAFQTIQLFWDYDSAVYISHYEVYGSQVSDFVPDEQHLLYRGRVSSFGHEVDTDEKWYYYVRAVNTRSTAGEFSNRVNASSARIINDDILFGEITADKLSENLDLANKLSEGTLDWINEDPLYEINEMNTRLLNQIDRKVDYIDYQNAMISIDNDINNINLSVVDVQGDVSNALSQITAIDVSVGNLSLSVSELTTDFEDLEIGGRNLVLDSVSRQFSYNTTFDLSDTASDYSDKPTVLSFTLKSNTTLSFRLNIGNRGLGRSFTYTDVNEKVDYVFKFDETNMPDKITFSEQNGEPNQVNIITNIQLEKGNKATGWSPAPEDMADKEQIISYINLSPEGVRIHGEKVWITGQTSIDEGVIGTAAIADLAVDRFHLKHGIIENVHIEDATIEHGKMKSLNVDHVIAGQMSLNYLKAGTIDTDKFLVRGGNSTDYTKIDGSYLESRGRYSRTWLGTTTIHDVSTRHENGYIRMRNNSADHSLYFSDFGLSTYIDGEGPHGGSSGSLLWWDRTYSPSSVNGITLNSYGGVAALSSDKSHVVLDSERSVKIMSRNSSVFIKPTTDRQRYNQTFNFTTAVGSGYGYMMYGDEDTGIWRSGFRFSHGSGPTIYLVDENFASGGNTTLDSGRIWTNDIRKRGGTGNGVYWNGSSGGTLNDGTNPGNTLSASGIITNFGDRDMHLGTRTGSVRVTNDHGYNGGNGITYRPIVASAFTQASSIKYKTNIEEVDNVALDIINALTVVEYNLKDDLENGVYDRQVGLIAENSCSVAVEDNTAIGLYKLTSYNTKAIQEVDLKFTNKVVNIEDRLYIKDLQIQYLQQKLAIQDKKIKKLEKRVA